MILSSYISSPLHVPGSKWVLYVNYFKPFSTPWKMYSRQPHFTDEWSDLRRVKWLAQYSTICLRSRRYLNSGCVCVCVYTCTHARVWVCVCVYSSLLLALELNAQQPLLGWVPFKLQLAPLKMTLAPISYVWVSIIKNFPTADDFYFMNTWKYMSHIRVLTSFYLSSENSFIKKCHLFYTIMLCEGLFIALWKLGNVVFPLTFRKIVKH